MHPAPRSLIPVATLCRRSASPDEVELLFDGVPP